MLKCMLSACSLVHTLEETRHLVVSSILACWSDSCQVDPQGPASRFYCIGGVHLAVICPLAMDQLQLIYQLRQHLAPYSQVTIFKDLNHVKSKGLANSQ